MRLPLSGITVLSLEQAIAAPLASRHLADWGARVIKIERPDSGDFARGYDATMNGLSSQFAWANRSKESVALDIKSAPGRQALDALLVRADVFIQNLAPGAAAKLGLDAQTLVGRQPRLIACDVSGYGADGPYSGKKAYDLLVQCETSFVAINGTEASPAKCGLAIADIAAGMYVLQGVLMALLHRERTGCGTAFEVSLFDALSEWMSYPAYYTRGGGAPPERSGMRHATIAPYGPFRAGDGRTIFFGIQNEREWIRFCRTVLQDEALAADRRYASNPARLARREELEALIETRFSAWTGEAARREARCGGNRQCPAERRRGFSSSSAVALAQADSPGRKRDRPAGDIPPRRHHTRPGPRHGPHPCAWRTYPEDSCRAGPSVGPRRRSGSTPLTRG